MGKITVSKTRIDYHDPIEVRPRQLNHTELTVNELKLSN